MIRFLLFLLLVGFLLAAFPGLQSILLIALAVVVGLILLCFLLFLGVVAHKCQKENREIAHKRKALEKELLKQQKEAFGTNINYRAWKSAQAAAKQGEEIQAGTNHSTQPAASEPALSDESAQAAAACHAIISAIEKSRQEEKAHQLEQERKKKVTLARSKEIAFDSFLEGDPETAKCWLYFLNEESKSRK